MVAIYKRSLSKAQQVFSDRIRSERNESPQISNRLFSKQAKKNLGITDQNQINECMHVFNKIYI